MTFETAKTGDFKASVKEPTDYHQSAFGNGKLWIFSQKYSDQKTFNWGHRVQFTGGYAIAYNLSSKSFEQVIEVPSLSEEENADELIFSHGGSVYLLLTTSFGTPSFRALYKWTGLTWQSIAEFKTESGGDENIYWALADGEGKDGEKYIVATTCGAVLQVYKLTITGDAAAVESFATIGHEVNPLMGRPIGGVVTGGSLYVSIGVHGCGFQWEKKVLIRLELESKKASDVEIEGSYEDLPPFSFSGPHLKEKGRQEGQWLAIGGSQQYGMTGSNYVGQVWSVDGIPDAPKWTKHDLEIPEDFGKDPIGAVDPATGILYLVGPETVIYAQL